MMSNHTIPTVEGLSSVCGSVPVGISDMAAASCSPLNVSITSSEPTSRTSTSVTVAGTGNPLVSCSS